MPGRRALCYVDLLALVPQACGLLRIAVQEASLHKFMMAFQCLGDAPAFHTHCPRGLDAGVAAVSYELIIYTFFGCGAPTFLRQPGKP